MKFKMFQMVRIKGEKPGSINEFAHVRGVFDDGTYWVSNLNMPFSGSISAIVTDKDIERLA